MSLKVGELFAVVGLEDELSDDLLRVERRFERTAESMDADANLGLDDSRFEGTYRDANGRLRDIESGQYVAKVDADIEPLKKKADEAESILDGVGDDIVGAGAGLAFGSVLVDDITTYFERDKAGDRIAAGMNLDKAADEQMRRVARSIHTALGADTYDEAMTATASVIGTFRQLGDVGDAELQRLASQVHALADVSDSTDEEIAAGASALFEQHLVPTYQAGLDVMAAGLSDVAPAMQSDLLDVFNEGEYLEFFERVGYSAQEMTSAIVAASAEGSFALDKMPDALAEFNKIIGEGVSDEQQAWFDNLGMSSWAFMDGLRKGGPEARAQIEQLLDAVSRFNEFDRNNFALDFFGSPGEDIGFDNIYRSLMPSDEQLQQIDGRAQEIGERYADQVNGAWERTWRANEHIRQDGLNRIVENGFGESMGALVEEFEQNWGGLMQNIGGKVDTVEDAFGEIPGWFGGLWEQIEDGVGRIPEAIGGAFDPLEEIMTAPFRALVDAWNGLDPSVHVAVPDWVPGIGGRSLDIDDLFPDLPTFHTGGDVLAPMPGGEVFAKLLDGERVLNRSEATAYRAGEAAAGSDWRSAGRPNVTYNVSVNVAGTVKSEHDLIQAVEMGLRRSARARK